MKRYDQIDQFRKCFPTVNTSTTNGVLMLQGFINGYNAGHDRFQGERIALKSEIKRLKDDARNLNEHIVSMNTVIRIQEKWQKTGEEI